MDNAHPPVIPPAQSPPIAPPVAVSSHQNFMPIVIIFFCTVLFGAGYFLVGNNAFNTLQHASVQTTTHGVSQTGTSSLASQVSMHDASVMKQPTATPMPTSTPVPATPYDKLAAAVAKTMAATSAELKYSALITTNAKYSSNGSSFSVNSAVEGTLLAPQDDGLYFDMKISKVEMPNVYVYAAVKRLATGEWYVKNSIDSPKWQKVPNLTSQQPSQDTSTPTDASLYFLNIMSAIFSPKQMVFASLPKTSFLYLGEVTHEGKVTYRYNFPLDVSTYLAALEKEKFVQPKDIADAKKILANATMTVIYMVDKDTGYVSDVAFTAKNLTQISTAESEAIGISVTHDMGVDVHLSRFGEKIEVTAPPAEEVLGARTGPRLPTLLKSSDLRKK